MSLPVHRQGCLNYAGLLLQSDRVSEFFFLVLNYLSLCFLIVLTF